MNAREETEAVLTFAKTELDLLTVAAEVGLNYKATRSHVQVRNLLRRHK